MSQAYRVRPSQLLGVSDAVRAYHVDRAVFTFASTVENAQETAVGRLPKNAKEATHAHVRQMVLDKYLGLDAGEAKGRFADPAGKVRG